MAKAKTKDQPTLTVKLDLLRQQANAPDVRKQLAKAGFDMAPDDETGWTFIGHGVAPDFHTGLVNPPNLVVDYNKGTVQFDPAPQA